MIKHSILGDKVHVYKRDNSKFWQCSTYLQGKNHRTSTKEDIQQAAKDCGVREEKVFIFLS